MCEQNASYLEKQPALRIRVKNFKEKSPEIYSKSTKIAIAARKFLKFFPKEHAPGLQRVLFVSQSASNYFGPPKNPLEKVWKLCPPFKILATPLGALIAFS